MRIVYVTANFPYGNGEAYVESELAELGKQGHEIIIVPRSTRGFVLSISPRSGWRVLPGSVFSPRIALKALTAFVRRPRRVVAAVALLKDRSHLARNLAVVPKALWLADVADRWPADHIHAHWASTTSTMAMLASELTSIPWSLTAHRWDIEDGNLMALKINRASFTRAISRVGLDLLSRRADKGDRSKIHVVHMGVEVPHDLPRRTESGPEADQFALVCVGHLNEGKGHELLFDAIAGLDAGMLQKVSLLIAGDGPLMGALQAKAIEIGIEQHLRFTGHMAHGELLSLYESGAIDVVVLPSCMEGIPVSLMEAMSYGIPVIATRVGGVPELCGDDCGVLIPPDDCSALTEAIASLLADRARMASLGERGRRRVMDEFAVERTAAQLAALMIDAARGRFPC